MNQDTRPTTRDQLIATLLALGERDEESAMQAHEEADQALLAFINDSEITKAFNNVPKWYA